MKNSIYFISLLIIMVLATQSKIFNERQLKVRESLANKNAKWVNRKLTGINELLAADDIEEVAERSRISDLDARQMAMNASQKQQKLSHLLNLVNNFKSAMEEVTTSLNGQISQINGLLSQVKD